MQRLANRSEFEAAAEILRGIVVPTPLVPLRGNGGGGDILLKPEILQPSGSFKIRGVYCAVARLPEERRRAGLSTVSAGNTAKALAWCGRRFGIPARSRMPSTAPASKVEAFRALGGTPSLVPVDELFRFIRERGWSDEPYAYVDPWTDLDVQLGHGTIALEILAERPDVDTIYVPVGGGGLLAGVAAAVRAVKPSVRIVAVEPEGCPTLHTSVRAGRPVEVACDTMCDGVAVPFVLDSMFPLLRDLADDFVLVPEAAVRATIRRIAVANHLVAEGAGALAAAAALAAPRSERGTAVALLTGGSIDPKKLADILGEAEDVPEPQERNHR